MTFPITVARTSQRVQIAITSSRSEGSTIASIRSWLSLVMISCGCMPSSRHGTAVTSTSIPTPPRDAVSEVAHVRPAPPRSWMPTTSPASSSARQASISRFSSNGSPTCTRRPLRRVGVSLREARRGEHAHATDAVATGRRAEEHREVADAARLAEHEPFAGQHAEAQHVDERVALVGGVEDDLAADRRHADRVAVARDAADDALGDPTAAGVVERPESQRIHERDRPGAHREDVAQDAADTRRRTLVGLDGRRVVVALDADRRPRCRHRRRRRPRSRPARR